MCVVFAVNVENCKDFIALFSSVLQPCQIIHLPKCTKRFLVNINSIDMELAINTITQHRGQEGHLQTHVCTQNLCTIISILQFSSIYRHIHYISNISRCLIVDFKVSNRKNYNNYNSANVTFLIYIKLHISLASH